MCGLGQNVLLSRTLQLALCYTAFPVDWRFDWNFPPHLFGGALQAETRCIPCKRQPNGMLVVFS